MKWHTKFDPCAFQKAWTGGQETAFKKEKRKEPKVSNSFFYAISLIVTKVLLLPQPDLVYSSVQSF